MPDAAFAMIRLIYGADIRGEIMVNRRRRFISIAVSAALVTGLVGCMTIQEKYNIYQNAKWQVFLQDGWYPYIMDDSYGKDTSEDDTETATEKRTEDNKTESNTENTTENNSREQDSTESAGGGNGEEIYADDLRYKTGLLHTSRQTWTAPDVCNDLYEFADAIDSYVLAGCRDDIKLYIDGITDSDIKNLNEYLTQSFGWGDRYLIDKDADGEYVSMSLQYEDSYYVYMYVVYGIPIPEDNSRALEIYNVLQAMYKEVDLTKLDEFYTELFYHDIVTYMGKYDDAAAESVTNGGSDTEEYGNAFTVYGTLVEGDCVCSGYAKALDLMFKLSGMDSYYAIGYAKENPDDTIQNANDDYGHAWNIVSIDGKWYQLDSTWNDSTELKSMAGIENYYFYFNVDDEIAGAQRTWDTRLYPACDSMDMNYYNAVGKYMKDHGEFTAYLSGGDSEEEDIYDIAVADYSESTYTDSDILYGEHITDDYTVMLVKK